MENEIESVWIPKEVQQNHRISVDAKDFLVILSTLQPEDSFLSLDWLYKVTGLKGKKLTKIINELNKEGLLSLTEVEGGYEL